MLYYYFFIIMYICYYSKYLKEVLYQQGTSQAISSHLTLERFPPSGTVLGSFVTFGERNI